MSRFKHLLEYSILKTVEFLLCAIPLSWALAAGERLGLLMSVILKKRQVLIVDNLTHAFPEKTADEINAIAKKNWKNLGRTALEFVRSRDLFTDNGANFSWQGAEQLDQALKLDRGAILISFHFTNWEILGMAVQARFKNMMAIARPMKNPYAEEWLKSKRAQGGMKITLHREAVKASLRWLKLKNMVGILVDQNLYHGGIFVNFFGRPAATTTLPALLHVRTGAPVFITHSLRDGKIFRCFAEPVELPEVADDEQRLIIYTQLINDQLERIIRAHPENWFWIHNRWKRKPDPVPAVS